MAALPVKTRRGRYATHSTFEALRAEALFASTLQSSESPSPDEVRRAVATTLRRVGTRGCAAQLAGEFGDHPDIAAARMTWALTTIRTVYELHHLRVQAAPTLPVGRAIAGGPARGASAAASTA